MKHFEFRFFWSIIFCLSMLWDQQCHGMKFWDKNLQQHIRMSVDTFFTGKPPGNSETYFEIAAQVANLRRLQTITSGLTECNIQAFWIPRRKELYLQTRPNGDCFFEERECPFYGLGRFLFEAFMVKKKEPFIVIDDPQERIEFGNRLYQEICDKFEGRAGFNYEIKEEFRQIINNCNAEPTEFVRPMPDCFYSGQARLWIGSSFALTFGLFLIGCVTHFFRNRAKDATKREKSDRKKAIICSAVLAGITGAFFAASYWELGSHYNYKFFFNIPPAPKV